MLEYTFLNSHFTSGIHIFFYSFTIFICSPNDNFIGAKQRYTADINEVRKTYFFSKGKTWYENSYNSTYRLREFPQSKR